MAQRRWQRLNGGAPAALVRAGVPFIDGVLEERCQTKQEVQKEAA